MLWGGNILLWGGGIWEISPPTTEGVGGGIFLSPPTIVGGECHKMTNFGVPPPAVRGEFGDFGVPPPAVGGIVGGGAHRNSPLMVGGERAPPPPAKGLGGDLFLVSPPTVGGECAPLVYWGLDN